MLNNTVHRNQALLESKDSVLVLVDIQERFRKAIPEMESVIKNSQTLLKVASHLNIPIVWTEQYPSGLGNTVSELQNEQYTENVIEKMTFSAVGEGAFVEKLRALGKKHYVLAGVETHVCVLQTAMDLIANVSGWVYVAEDAVSSRKPVDKERAIKRLEKNHVEIVSTEMVFCEWLKKAGTSDFKELQKLWK